MNEQSHSNKFSVHLSSIHTDWRSSSSKLRKLAKSSSSTALSLLRSSVEKVPSSNIWRQHEFITAGLRSFHLGWDHCHLVGFIWMHLVCFAPPWRRCTKTVLLLLRCTMDENEMIISMASKSRSLVTAAWNAKQLAVQTICLNLTV